MIKHMFNLQTAFNNAVQAKRQEELLDSDQLVLSELISRLKEVKNKELPVFFSGTEYRPTAIGSWRGIYRELAIAFDGTYDGFNSEEVDHVWEYDGEKRTSYKKESTDLPSDCTVEALLSMLERCVGKTFEGYKGGDYVMGRLTPVWIANYSECDGPNGKNAFVTGVAELEDKILIEWQNEKSDE